MPLAEYLSAVPKRKAELMREIQIVQRIEKTMSIQIEIFSKHLGLCLKSKGKIHNRNKNLK